MSITGSTSGWNEKKVTKSKIIQKPNLKSVTQEVISVTPPKRDKVNHNIFEIIPEPKVKLNWWKRFFRSW